MSSGTALRQVLIALMTIVAVRAAAADPELPAMAPAPAGTTLLGTASIVRLNDDWTMQLDDGRTARLAGIELPGAGQRLRGADPALARAAVAALDALVRGKSVELRSAGNPTDRHGRVVAHIVVDGQWVEAALLRLGLARVHSQADNRAGVAEMLTVEATARRGAIGLWADRAYAVRPAGDAGFYAGTFQILDGTVVDAALVDGQVYVHFGADWHSSFSLHLAGDARRLCRAAGLDPMTLARRHVRVRGFIDGTTRPVMEITHPEQIELL